MLLQVIRVYISWGFLDPNIWGAKQGRGQDFGLGEGTSDKILYMDSSKSCTEMASPKFRFWKNIQQKCIHQRLVNNFEKFIKQVHKNLKNSPNFSKII